MAPGQAMPCGKFTVMPASTQADISGAHNFKTAVAAAAAMLSILSQSTNDTMNLHLHHVVFVCNAGPMAVLVAGLLNIETFSRLTQGEAVEVALGSWGVGGGGGGGGSWMARPYAIASC